MWGTGSFYRSQTLGTLVAPRVKRLIADCFGVTKLLSVHCPVKQHHEIKTEELWEVKSSKRAVTSPKYGDQKFKRWSGGKKKFGTGSVYRMVSSEIFGDFENFVNLIGKDCSEVGSGVPGHVGAEGDFTDILGILSIPDLWHAAPGPGRSEIKEKNKNNNK